MQLILPPYILHATDQRLGQEKRQNGEQARHPAIDRKGLKGESGDWNRGGIATPQELFGDK